MLSNKVKKTLTLGGETFSESQTISGDAALVHNVLVVKSEGGSLTTRTSDIAGTFTADDSAHPIVDGDRVDLYWIESGVQKAAFGAIVGTVAGAAIPFTAIAGGDILPAALTDMSLSKSVELDLAVNGTNVKSIILFSESYGQFIFEDAGGVEFAQRVGDGIVWDFDENQGEVNPITGDSIINVFVSHKDEVDAKTMKVGVLYDND